MRIRATSDLHITPVTWPWVARALGEIRADIERTGHGDVTVLCGDLFDQAETVHVPTYNAVRDTLRNWPGPVFIVPGNHDQYEGRRNVLEALASKDRQITVATEAQNTRWGTMVPYMRQLDDFEAAVHRWTDSRSHWGEETPRILWCHQGFRGAYLNGMRKDVDGFPCTSVPDDMVTITGHYHCPQNLGRIIYCGSPYETTFAEEGQRKGWLFWENAAQNPIPTRVLYGDLGSPRHHTVRWDPEEGAPAVPTGIRPGDRVRVRTRATRKEADDAAGQLATVGLGAVPVVAEPNEGGSRGIVAADDGPVAAALAYATRVIGARGTVEPATMISEAERVNLWQGV